jgi:hypothetical protein
MLQGQTQRWVKIGDNSVERTSALPAGCILKEVFDFAVTGRVVVRSMENPLHPSISSVEVLRFNEVDKPTLTEAFEFLKKNASANTWLSIPPEIVDQELRVLKDKAIQHAAAGLPATEDITVDTSAVKISKNRQRVEI